MINIEGWSVGYPDGTVALDGLSLSVDKGEHLALIGSNGAGKSTLILSLVGLLHGEGKVEIGGTLLSKATVNEIRAKAGVVFQNPDDQLFMPTIYEDVAFGVRNLGLDEATVLAMKPDVMLFDEPTAFLDPKARRKLIGILCGLPHTMIIATHDLSFALQVCPRCAILHHGKLFATGDTRRLLFDSATMEAADMEAADADATPRSLSVQGSLSKC